MPWQPFDNIWDGSDWSAITGSDLHPGMFVSFHTDLVATGAAVVCYDSLRNRVLLYGATQIDDVPPTFQAAADFRGFWEYDVATGQWSELSPANRPPLLPTWGWRVMEYDAARDKVVLVQTSSTNGKTQTWEYDASDWTMIIEDGAPNAPTATTTAPVTYLHWGSMDMVYDAGSAEMVFVQADDSLFAQRITWTYNGTWTHQTPDGSARDNTSAGTLAYDRNRAVVISFDGDFAHTGTSEDWNCTEEWSSHAWTIITTRTLSGGDYHITHPTHNPISKNRPAMVNDPVNNKVFLLNDGGAENPSLSPKEGFTDQCAHYDGVAQDWLALSPAHSPVSLNPTQPPAFWSNAGSNAWPASFDNGYFYEPLMVELSDRIFLVGGLYLIDDVKAISHTFGLA